MSYQAIVIDDEPWSLIDIQKTFPFEKYGFELAGSYQSADEALADILLNAPDLVVTDVLMPGTSGIELMRQLREAGMSSEVVIVSGFSDFAYAKEAVRHGAADYCLKPTNAKEADETLARVRRRLDARYGTPTAQPTDEASAAGGFDALVAYIGRHYFEKLVLGDLANRFGLHPNYCGTLFAKRLGTSFSQYVAALRVQKAKELIESSDETLENIAKMVGYTDYFYFSKVFKKLEGISPRKYKKQREEGAADET